MPLHVPRCERAARRLGGELEALTRALEEAGARGPEAARLLELASLATMQVVGLEHALALRDGAGPERRAENGRAGDARAVRAA